MKMGTPEAVSHHLAVGPPLLLCLCPLVHTDLTLQYTVEELALHYLGLHIKVCARYTGKPVLCDQLSSRM